MIDALYEAGAEVVVFDVFFDLSSWEDEDQALAEAIKRAGNVVLGF